MLCIDNWTDVQYPFTRQAIEGCIQDIHDGRRYQKMSGPGKLFSVPERTGLILCADGVLLFKSSGNYWMHAVRVQWSQQKHGYKYMILTSQPLQFQLVVNLQSYQPSFLVAFFN